MLRIHKYYNNISYDSRLCITSMISSIAGSAINTAGNITSTTLTNASNERIAQQNNDTSIQIHREDNAFNAEQAQLDRDFQAEQAQINRDYNSLQNQVKQAQEAGLNPTGLDLSPGTSTSTPSGAQASSSPAPMLSTPQLQSPTIELGSAVQDAIQTAKLDSERKKVEVETKGQEIENKIRDIQSNYTDEQCKYSLEQAYNNIKNTKVDTKTKEANISLLHASAKKIRDERLNLYANTYYNSLRTHSDVTVNENNVQVLKAQMIQQVADFEQRERFYIQNIKSNNLKAVYQYGGLTSSNSSYSNTHGNQHEDSSSSELSSSFGASFNLGIDAPLEIFEGGLTVSGSQTSSNKNGSITGVHTSDTSSFGESSTGSRSKNVELADALAKVTACYQILSTSSDISEINNAKNALKIFEPKLDYFKMEIEFMGGLLQDNEIESIIANP